MKSVQQKPWKKVKFWHLLVLVLCMWPAMWVHQARRSSYFDFGDNLIFKDKSRPLTRKEILIHMEEFLRPYPFLEKVNPDLISDSRGDFEQKFAKGDVFALHPNRLLGLSEMGQYIFVAYDEKDQLKWAVFLLDDQ